MAKNAPITNKEMVNNNDAVDALLIKFCSTAMDEI